MEFFQRLSIRSKLILIMSLVGATSILVVGYQGFRSGRDALTTRIAQHLEGQRTSKAQQIEGFFQRIHKQLQILSSNATVIEAFRHFDQGFQALHKERLSAPQVEELRFYYRNLFLPKLRFNMGGYQSFESYWSPTHVSQYLQHQYIAANPYPVGSKELLDAGKGTQSYHKAHAAYHPMFRRYLRKFGYYDIFLISQKHQQVLYSVRKESEFATGLRNGPYRVSGLALAVRRVEDATDRDATGLVDYMPYEPSYGSPASFIASPIFDGAKRLGTMVFQVPAEEIDRIMTNQLNWKRDGLGQSGESYLIGPDMTMRSFSRSLLENPRDYFEKLKQQKVPYNQRQRIKRLQTTVLTQKVETKAAQHAIEGWQGVTVNTNYLGERVLTAYQPLHIGSLQWSVLTEISIKEAYQPIQHFQRNIFIVVAILLIFFFALFYTFANLFLEPIKALLQGTRIAAEGNTQIVIQSTAKDEFGELIQSFNAMIHAIDQQNTMIRQKSIEAMASNDAKSSFLANMSHEIRTPMNAIINMSKLTMETELSPKQHQYVQTIASSSQSLLTLINDILDLSKIEADKIDLEQTDFELRLILEDITNTFRAKVLEKHVELIVHTDLDVPHRLLGDPLRLRQVLVNLIGNAFKFTERGEVVLKVSITEGNQWASTLSVPQAVQLLFSVRDTGIGIPPDKLANLFEAFSQVDASTTRKYGGTGLGLTISRRLVDLMGGQLQVRSTLGQGSEFYFSIPMQLDADQTQTLDILPLALQQIHPLIVDDSNTSRELLKTMFSSFGMDSTTAATGEEALKTWQHAQQNSANPFGLVVLDWMLPDKDGLEVAKEMRADPNNKTPIIMISAYGGKEEEIKAKELGVNVFLPKPITTSNLMDAIMEVYDTGRSRRKKKAKTQLDIQDIFNHVPILLAEDNEVNQFVATELLAPSGARIDAVSNGQEAIDRAIKHKYALILMDLQMPVKDGLTATQELREIYDKQTLPIIALTANAMPNAIETCLELGMNDFVSKPIHRDQLFEVLKRWIPEEIRNAYKTNDPSPSAPPSSTTTPPTDNSADLSGNDETLGAPIISPQDPITLPPQTHGEDQLPPLEGFDIQGATLQLGLPPKAMRKILLAFTDNLPKVLQQLQSAVALDEPKQIRLHAHTISGSAGNLGALSLQAAAKALESAAKDETGNYQALLKHIEDAASIAQTALNTLQVTPTTLETRAKHAANPHTAQTPSSTSKPAPSTTHTTDAQSTDKEPSNDNGDATHSHTQPLFLQALQALQDSLEEFDASAATSQYSALKHEDIHPEQLPQLQRIGNLINDFELEEAARQLQQLRNTIK